MKEELTSPVGVGILSIMTILLVLVLSIFSCLTLTTAQADLALAKRGATTVTNYYETDAKAQEIYAQFLSSQDGELDTTLAIDEQLGLQIHLVRQSDGSVQIMHWNTVLLEEDSSIEEQPLPVWTGE